MKRKYIFLWCASFWLQGYFCVFFEFSLFGGGLFLFLSLMGILSGRVFGKTGAVWVCGALFYVLPVRSVWKWQKKYGDSSHSTLWAVKEPSAASLQRNLLWTKGRTDMPGTLLI